MFNGRGLFLILGILIGYVIGLRLGREGLSNQEINSSRRTQQPVSSIPATPVR